MSHAIAQSSAGLRERAQGLGDTLPHALLFLGVFIVTASLAAANGGYFPVSWGWSALGLLWAAVAALALRTSVELGRLEVAFVALVSVLVGWVWLSVAWSSDRAATVLEGQRGLVLVGAVVAVLFVASGRATRTILAAVLAAATIDCAYALATRLFPARVGTYDPVAVYRLSTPVGYWNGLGVLAALGTLLALGFAARGRAAITRALAAASLLIFVPTLYFTFSRGAWLALAVGIVALLVLDPRRLQLMSVLIVLAAPVAVAIALASHSHALTRQRSTLARATHDGHRLAIALVVLAVAAALIAVVTRELERRVSPPRAVRVAFAFTIGCIAVGLLVAAFAQYGSPPTMVRKAYHAFTTPPPRVTNLNARLFNLSSNGRTGLWHVAWRDTKAHPLLGAGAGSYNRYYLEHRETQLGVQDAHSLYLETLAELGPPGLLLLLAALGLPLVAAVRSRHHPFVPVAAAAYVVYLVHAVADWDWELAGVTLAAVMCGLACVLAGREEHEPRELGTRTRVGLGLAATVLGAVALVGLAGNIALAQSDSAAQAGHWRSAERHARTAIRWAPWSPAGWQSLAEAQLALHERANARRSLHKAVAKDPNDWVLWLDLVSASSGKEQLVALDKAFRLNPLSPEISPLFAAVARP